MGVYPDTPAARDRWILGRRPARNVLDPHRPYAYLVEPEMGADGTVEDVATVFLTNRECPWRCLMCDLWRNTTEETVPPGAIAEQVEFALRELSVADPARSSLKLYNAGSFFDPKAIPPDEYPAIARLAGPFRRTIVESHPALAGRRCLEFRDLLPGRLEVAMGLETAHPEVLDRLNKRMTLDGFRRAASFFSRELIELRVFILIRPPWLSEEEGLHWAKRSLDFAFECGASVCALIPTRPGNGAMEALGAFEMPRLESLESALEYGLSLGKGRVFGDVWDIEKFARCPACTEARIGRIRAMNGTQKVPGAIRCGVCAEAVPCLVPSPTREEGTGRDDRKGGRRSGLRGGA
jgi:radical SAM enzyme (TIGR01210 family)